MGENYAGVQEVLRWAGGARLECRLFAYCTTREERFLWPCDILPVSLGSLGSKLVSETQKLSTVVFFSDLTGTLWGWVLFSHLLSLVEGSAFSSYGVSVV